MKIHVVPGSFLIFLSIFFVVPAEEKARPVSVVIVANASIYDEIPLSGKIIVKE